MSITMSFSMISQPRRLTGYGKRRAELPLSYATALGCRYPACCRQSFLSSNSHGNNVNSIRKGIASSVGRSLEAGQRCSAHAPAPGAAR